MVAYQFGNVFVFVSSHSLEMCFICVVLWGIWYFWFSDVFMRKFLKYAYGDYKQVIRTIR